MADRQPDLSVIMPTRDRPSMAMKALESLLRQDAAAGRLEIVIVDNSPGGSLAGEVKRAAARSQATVRLLEQPVPGLLAGRHLGAARAGAELLSFLDDDIVAHEGWASSVLEGFKDPSVHLVTGPSLPVYGGEPPDWIDGFWTLHEGGRSCGYLSLLNLGGTRREIDPAYVWGLNFSVRKQTFLELGGFHPDAMPWELRRFRGDGENGLVLEARARGMKALYCPGAIVSHAVPAERLTEEYFLRRAFLQGVSDSYTHIRAAGGIGKAPASIRRAGFRRMLARASFLLQRPKDPSRRGRLRFEVDSAYLEGYRYHRREVASDPELLSWVLRDRYWDYSLPGLPPSLPEDLGATGGAVDGGHKAC